MAELKAYEPTATDLTLAYEAYGVELISFNRKAEKLASADFLPRYHRLKIKLFCRLAYPGRPLFLTIRRNGSKLGDDNFYTVPFFAEELSINNTAEYEMLSFDSFNLPFESMAVEMCRPQDYLERRVSLDHIERAKMFSKRTSR